MNVILDTSIIVEYSIDGIKDFIINDDRVFLTDIILQEMDGHKNSEEAKGYNAREFFRQMGNAKSEKANLSDIVLKDSDYISKYTLSNGLEIYTIVRNRYNSRDINDSKIIEIAKDYNLKLITRDMAQSVRAKAMGVEVEVVTGDSVNVKDRILDILINYIDTVEKDTDLKKNLLEFYDTCIDLKLRQEVLIDMYNFIKGKNIIANRYTINTSEYPNEPENNNFFQNNNIHKDSSSFAENNINNNIEHSQNDGFLKSTNFAQDTAIHNSDIMNNPVFNNTTGNIYHH